MVTCALIAESYNEFYLKEWILHHKSLGFSKIFIINRSSELINIDDLNDVLILGPNNFSHQINKEYYNQLLEKIWGDYDYCSIISVDEFFDFKKYKTVQCFVENTFTTDYTVAEIPWEVYDDNDLIQIDTVENKLISSLYSRVQDKVPFAWGSNSCSHGRSIFRLCDGVQSGPHWPNTETMNKVGGFKSKHVEKKDCLLKKYKTQCLKDYIYQHSSKEYNILKSYFEINHVSSQKLLWALRFFKDCNKILSEEDKYWLLNQFEKFPLITVVIRTHSRLNKLKDCLHYLSCQNYLGKILVLDDCSDDQTAEWLSKQDKISFVSLKTNLGPGEILSRGKYLITTPYYIILDDDDVWTNQDVFLNFYKKLIEEPYTDFIETGNYLHIGHVVSTELLLQCPNLSLWSRDDWYFDWLKISSKNKTKLSFNFYQYILEDDKSNNMSHYYDKTMDVSSDFYNKRNKEGVTEFIDQNYHISSPRERKVFDQIRLYYRNNGDFNQD